MVGSLSTFKSREWPCWLLLGVQQCHGQYFTAAQVCGKPGSKMHGGKLKQAQRRVLSKVFLIFDMSLLLISELLEVSSSTSCPSGDLPTSPPWKRSSGRPGWGRPRGALLPWPWGLVGAFHNCLLEESKLVYTHMYICTETKQAVSTYGTFGKDFTPNSCQFSNQKKLFNSLKNVGFRFGLNMHYVFYQGVFNTYIWFCICICIYTHLYKTI